ncbi:hypothetical protein ACIG63_45690 [Streptomyces antimycoticus]|uniref:hypothetical protein n=1 Tax=Streptomyces antimycoticus TaxID=68175 RepID=UPI0037D56B9A
MAERKWWQRPHPSRPDDPGQAMPARGPVAPAMPAAPPPPAPPSQPPTPTGPVPEPDMPQRDSVKPLWLPGWEAYSTWGYDTGTGSYYAQLYRDEDDRDAKPRHWISGTGQSIQHPQVLYMRIALATRAPLTAVYEALLKSPTAVAAGHRYPMDPIAPGGRTLAEIRHQLGAARTGSSGYEQGSRMALQWLLGEVPTAPCSGATVPDGGRPSPLAVAAEAWAATGAIYMTAAKELAAGAETALLWALGTSTTAP